MKPESLVIADQLRCGEYVLESCTHNKSAQQRNDPSGLNPLLSAVGERSRRIVPAREGRGWRILKQKAVRTIRQMAEEPVDLLNRR